MNRRELTLIGARQRTSKKGAADAIDARLDAASNAQAGVSARPAERICK